MRSSTAPTTTCTVSLVIEALLIDRTRLAELEPARADMLPKLAGWYGELMRGMSLDALIGEWVTEATFPDGMSGTGRTTFEWALGGAFLLQRAKADVDGAARGPVPDRGRRRRPSCSTTSTRAASCGATR